VILALDAVYDTNGKRDIRKTRLVIDNDFVLSLVADQPELLFGASIHPYRKDALDALQRLARNGACLVKWIPSTQIPGENVSAITNRNQGPAG